MSEGSQQEEQARQEKREVLYSIVVELCEAHGDVEYSIPSDRKGILVNDAYEFTVDNGSSSPELSVFMVSDLSVPFEEVTYGLDAPTEELTEETLSRRAEAAFKEFVLGEEPPGAEYDNEEGLFTYADEETHENYDSASYSSYEEYEEARQDYLTARENFVDEMPTS